MILLWLTLASTLTLAQDGIIPLPPVHTEDAGTPSLVSPRPFPPRPPASEPMKLKMEIWTFIPDQQTAAPLPPEREKLVVENIQALLNCMSGAAATPLDQVEITAKLAHDALDEVEAKLAQVEAVLAKLATPDFDRAFEALRGSDPSAARIVAVAALQEGFRRLAESRVQRGISQAVAFTQKELDSAGIPGYLAKARAALTVTENSAAISKDLLRRLPFSEQALATLVHNREAYDQASTTNRGKPVRQAAGLATFLLNQAGTLAKESCQDSVGFARNNAERGLETLEALATLTDSLHPAVLPVSRVAVGLLRGSVSEQDVQALRNPEVPGMISGVAANAQELQAKQKDFSTAVRRAGSAANTASGIWNLRF